MFISDAGKDPEAPSADIEPEDTGRKKKKKKKSKAKKEWYEAQSPEGYSYYWSTVSGGTSRNFVVNLWRRGLVVDIWLWDQKVPNSSPGYARLTLSSWERLFTCIFLTPLMCKTSTRL